MSGRNHWRSTHKNWGVKLEVVSWFKSYFSREMKCLWKYMFCDRNPFIHQQPLRDNESLYDSCEILSGWLLVLVVVVVVVVVVVRVSNHQQVAKDMFFFCEVRYYWQILKTTMRVNDFYLGEFLRISQNVGSNQGIVGQRTPMENPYIVGIYGFFHPQQSLGVPQSIPW